MAGVVGNQAGSSKFSVASPEFALGSASGAASGTSNSVADAVSGLTSGASPFATILTEIVNNSSGKLDVVLSALEEQNVLRTLAEPNLIAMSGETADFLAGGEYPVPVVSAASAGALPTITIIYKEFGVKLSFTPTVLTRGVISLKLMPEVSELDFTNAVTVAGATIPALTVRRARTTVELRDGQSFGIAGLLQASSTRDQNQVPWLGSVPVIGALFRSAAYQANETELVVLVTPYLIKPVPPDKKLKTLLDTSLAGNDFDYFLNGQPEVPKTPPFTFNPFGGVQSLFGAVEPGPPVPAPVPVLPAAPVPVAGPVPVPAPVPVPVAAPAPVAGPVPVPAPVPVPVAAPAPVPMVAPEPVPVPQGNGALYYDPATGYFVDPPADGGG
jgi:pilus assembly protein CpaC